MNPLCRMAKTTAFMCLVLLVPLLLLLRSWSPSTCPWRLILLVFFGFATVLSAILHLTGLLDHDD